MTAPATTWRYGDHPAQVADLYLPPAAAGDLSRQGSATRGIVVLVHGGYWRARYDRSLQESVAADLVARGWAVWNLDYRAVGHGPQDGGGWPRTFLDVAAGADLLVEAAAAHGLPPDDAVAIGHSAGGAMALWLAGRHRLADGLVGARPRLRPRAVVAQGAICDLVTAARDALGGQAIPHLMGGRPGDGAPLDAAYANANPTALLPLGVPVLLVTGDADDAVPHRQSTRFAQAARAAGDDVTLHVIRGDGHFVHLDPTSAAWQYTLQWIGTVQWIDTGQR